MIQVQNNKKYDLEERTLKFAKNCRELVSKLKKTIANTEDGRQLIRSSGSVMANYIEANEALSKKDFSHRIKICRKESKESEAWLRLVADSNPTEKDKCGKLISEAVELRKIFGAILEKSK